MIEHVRDYSEVELAALRAVKRREWSHPGDPSEHGPAQYAGGDYWPSELLQRASQMERDAMQYRIAADAMRREIAADPRCSS